MSKKAVLETTPELRDRAKKIAKDQGCSTKQLTCVIMDRGLADFEQGKLFVHKSVDLVEVPTREIGA